jgi:uncharacterized protein YdeI (YjbR/CyaY-like superfamily)
MNFTNQVYFPDREKWRDWLVNNHDKEKEAWLIFFKKHTGKPTVAYGDAVEEALCFGWIDSTVRRIDEERYMQHFTPRKPIARWSPDNVLRVKRMIEQKRMTRAGMEKYREFLDHPGRLVVTDKPADNLQIPADLLKILEMDPLTLKKFTALSKAYKHLCIRWIDAAKKTETRIKRINEVAVLTSKGQKIGMK